MIEEGEFLNNKRPFTEYELPELDFSLMSPTEASIWIGNLATKLGFSPDEILYCGIDGRMVRLNGTFGSRTETWAVTYDEVLTSGDKAESYGQWGSDSPFYYALHTETPTIVLFDKSKLTSLEDTYKSANDEIRSEREYAIQADQTIDDSVVAVAYITS